MLGGCHRLLPPVSRRHWPPAASGRGAAATPHRRVWRKAARRSMRHRGVDWTLRELAVTSNKEANRPSVSRCNSVARRSSSVCGGTVHASRGAAPGVRVTPQPWAARLPGWPAATAPNNKTTTRKQMSPLDNIDNNYVTWMRGDTNIRIPPIFTHSLENTQ